MRRKFVSMTTISLVLVLLSVLLRIQVVEAVIPYVYIRADGSVDPSFAPISSVDNITYTFTNDLYIPVIVERDNIIIDGADYTLSRDGTGRGIDLTSRHNITIKSLQIRSFQSGIWLAQASDCKIIENKISNSTFGVWVFGSNNTLYGNTVGNNSDSSIVMDFGSFNNTFYGNNIMNSSRGIWLIMASGNKFFHNNFVDNTQHVYVAFSGYANHWDDGYPSGGNYWSGYAGTDQHSGLSQNQTGRDGIGDIAYAIDANNTDHYPLMTVYSPIYEGNFILTDNDVYVIAGRFDVNGSIIVEKNATLILRNAILNVTQTSHWQFEMIFQHPAHGNPRLIVENGTVTANNLYMYVDFYGNTSVEANGLTLAYGVFAYLHADSAMSVMNSNIDRLNTLGSSTVESLNSTYSWINTHDNTSGFFSNCTTDILIAEEGTILTMTDCTVNQAFFIPSSVNYSVINHEPGFVDNWNFLQNCSVVAASTGVAPNVTLTGTWIYGWGFSSRENSNYTVFNSLLYALDSHDSSTVHVYNSTISWRLWSSDSSNVWLLNSTSSTFAIEEDSRIYVCWYLEVHVIDSIGQDVSSASVAAIYANSTTADSETTGEDGLAMLILTEKIKNATGDYPLGDYSVHVVYETHSNSTAVAMTENSQITMVLKNLIVPEFPLLLILPLFMMATLLAVIVYRRKRLV